MIVTKSKPYPDKEIGKLNMNTQQVLLALSSDLHRICNSILRSSDQVTESFSMESKRWLLELDKERVKSYMLNILDEIDKNLLTSQNNKAKAEQCLLYSTLLRNYAQTIGSEGK